MTTQSIKTASPTDEKFDFKRALPVFVIVLVDLLGLTIIIPLLHLYAASFEASALTIGIVATAYPLMQFIGAPLLGSLSDRFGRKPVLLVSQTGTFIGFLVLGFANSLWLILLARIIDGISGANIAAAQAALTDITTEKNRAQGLGLIGAAFGLGFTVGPVIALIALSLSGNNYAVPAFIAAGFSLLSILLTAFWFKETLPQEKRSQTKDKTPPFFSRLQQTLRNPLIGILLVLMFSQQMVFFGFENLLGLFTLNRLGLNGQGNTGLFVFLGIIIVVVQGGLIGPWSRKYGERRLIYAALLLLSLGLIFTSITPETPPPGYSREALIEELSANTGDISTGEEAVSSTNIPLPDDSDNGWLGVIWIAIALIPVSIGGGLLQPSINSLITKRIRPEEIGTVLGVSAAFISAANAVTPVFGGFVFQQFGSTVPFLGGGIMIAVLLVIALLKVQPGPEEQVAPSAA